MLKRSREWFYRRPLFWCALAAIGAVLASYGWHLPALLWLEFAAVLIPLAISRLYELATLLAIAVTFGAVAAVELLPPRAGPLHEGAAVTVYGSVVQAIGEEGAAVVRIERRLTLEGWLRADGRIGVRLPEPAQPGDLLQLSGLLRRPEPATNPGAGSPRLSWLRRGVSVVLKPRPGGVLHLGQRRPPWPVRLGRALRDRLLAANHSTLPPVATVVAGEFIVGDAGVADASLVERVEAAFQGSGTIHLLVVSGTQVMLILWLFLWLSERFWNGRYLFWSLGLLTVAFFYAMTDGSASVQRAAVMGGVYVGALLLTREPDPENTLGAAALVLLALNRFAVFDVGAVLSFTAVWALVRVGGPLARALGPSPDDRPGSDTFGRRLHRTAAEVAAACVAAHLGTAPIVALVFQRSTWSGVLANLVMVPLSALFTGMAFVHGLLSLAGVRFLGWFVAVNAEALYGWARLFSQPPLGTMSVFPAPLWVLPCCFAGFSLAPRLQARRQVLLTAACVAGLLLLTEHLPAPPPREPTVRAIDVGQGDSVLLQGTDGSNVLVDTGPPPLLPGRSTVVQTLRALRIARLDAVLISHPHLDHVGQLPDVLRAFTVGELLCPDLSPAYHDEPDLPRAIAETGVSVKRPGAGERIPLRSSTLTMLGPLEHTGDLNEESLVARWDSGDARVLLTGDMDAPSEASLLRWGPELHAAVLKVAHHGSRTSSSPEWLRAVAPRMAVISCGRHNRFGHPSRETLEHLQAAGVPVVRTDQSGMITLRLRRDGIAVERYVTEW